MAALYWTSFALLLLTKVADVISTWRHVGLHGEANPLAAALFRRLGLGGGVAVVSAIYLLLATGQYLSVWWLDNTALLLANTALGLGIAWVQWDVARFNATRRHSRLTALAMRVCARAARARRRA